MSATEEQLNERRVKAAHTKWKKARATLDTHMEAHQSVFSKAYDLVDNVNTNRKRFEQACRETGIGIGPVTVILGKKIHFDVDYIEGLFPDGEVPDDLITVKKTVQKAVFESLVRENVINKRQAKRAITSEERTQRVSGVPAEIVLP